MNYRLSIGCRPLRGSPSPPPPQRARMPIRCSMLAPRELDMKRAMLMVMLATSVMMDCAGRASAPESVWHVAATERDERTGEPVRVHDLTQAAERATIRTPLNNPESVTLEADPRGDPDADWRRPGRRRRHGDVPGRVGRLQARGDVGGHRRPWRAGLGRPRGRRGHRHRRVFDVRHVPDGRHRSVRK